MSRPVADAEALNEVVLSGVVVETPELRYTPAGTAVLTWVLEHRSQVEDLPPLTETTVQMHVVVLGALADQWQGVQQGERVRVRGKLNRKRHQRNDQIRWGRLELVARQVKMEPATAGCRSGGHEMDEDHE
ncbi:single-strand binding protein/Primosomal replication protein n [Magnetococcus marinus MC-1]|uniref:Single-strand binding protein/Primosomal replication protein n n=1 Tax=Magnetococcus marinus (strain ATCC BAA-1437 / JCM 17883 / MC-1) TaxID=156889 RepID=A0LAG8_MAGMM|nr:primosomal replication protein N [Magnetococcus marinus]ABK44961.1 single-strand binding protein/Primosomal replication protein n [Magnetococcus marinus MC-1]